MASEAMVAIGNKVCNESEDVNCEFNCKFNCKMAKLDGHFATNFAISAEQSLIARTITFTLGRPLIDYYFFLIMAKKFHSMAVFFNISSIA